MKFEYVQLGANASSPEIEALWDNARSISQKLISDFYETLEAKLAEAVKLGVDVATATDNFPLEIRFVIPGGELPTGRRGRSTTQAGVCLRQGGRPAE